MAEQNFPVTMDYPFSSKDIYYSRALLDDVRRVECYLDNTEAAGATRSCIGVLLEYSHYRREALGECRVGYSKTIHVNAPTILHLKPGTRGDLHSRAWFTSSTSEAQELQRLGWEQRQMSGALTWWFGFNVIEIVHSLDRAGE